MQLKLGTFAGTQPLISQNCTLVSLEGRSIDGVINALRQAHIFFGQTSI